VLLSGNVAIRGNVDGDLFLLNGTLTLEPPATIGGNLTVGGGVLHRAPEAAVAGQVITGAQLPDLAPSPSPADQVIQALLAVVVIAPLTYLLVFFLPRPVARVARAIEEQPVAAGALGILVGIVAPSLLVLMAFTIVLIPVAMLGGIVLGATAVYGWIALGLVVGRLVARRPSADLRPATTAVLGVILLTLLVHLISLVPLVGIVTLAVVAAVGLGAVLLTAFGTRVFVPASATEADERGEVWRPEPGGLGRQHLQ
jgi:hypothetical protein